MQAGSAVQSPPPTRGLCLQIVGVEPHSRAEQDWYAATVAVDVLAFLYAVLFYQARHPSPTPRAQHPSRRSRFLLRSTASRAWGSVQQMTGLASTLGICYSA